MFEISYIPQFDSNEEKCACIAERSKENIFSSEVVKNLRDTKCIEKQRDYVEKSLLL